MGKANNTRRSQLETGHIGCMWGIIRMLNFRRDPKMLLRQSHRQTFINRFSRGKPSEISEIIEAYDSDDLDETEIKPTVKKLMQDEMTKGKTVKRKKPNDEIEKTLSEYKKTKQKRPRSKPNPSPNPNPNPNSTESTDLELVLAAFLIEIHRYHNHNECEHIDCKNKTGLCPTLKSIVSSKLHDRNNNNNNNINCNDNNIDNFGNNLNVSQSKEFTNALEILSSNKELFLKILQDPDSRVLEKIQEINSKRERKRFFKRKEQPEGKTDNSQTVSKIVVLKPKARTKPSSSYDEKIVSNFSFREIKRRLRYIIGESAKERDLNTSLIETRKDPHLFKIVSGSNKKTGASFYEEAKKHLTEMLENGDKIEVKKKNVSKQLGQIISVKEDNLQKCPSLEKEESFSKSEIVTKEELVRNNGIEDNEKEIKNERINLEMQHGNEIEEEILDEGDEYTREVKSDECAKSISIEECNISSETLTQDPEQELIEEPETVKETVEDLISSPKSVHEASTSCSENNNIDQPSPVSVLDKLFCEDISSPDCKITYHDELHESPSHSCSNITPLLEDTNARFEFIKLVLEASGLCKEESLERRYMSDELLEPSLFDQFEILYAQSEDSRLLFDCINEVLIGIQRRCYRLAPSVHAKCDLLHQVFKEVDWHVENKWPSFIDRDWLDLREENEEIVSEIWDELIDDLLEETVFDLWL